jgi:hypothetical protein
VKKEDQVAIEEMTEEAVEIVVAEAAEITVVVEMLVVEETTEDNLRYWCR